MGLLEVAGPVMIGPSSSHTLGALRIARFVHKMTGIPEEVEFLLHGSFASTYWGHGTDRALLAGILGLREDDPEVKDPLPRAREAGLRFSFVPADLGEVHPNTVLIRARVGEVRSEVEGASIGGGAIRITKLNGVACSIAGDMPTLVVRNRDVPGALREILRHIEVNIANVYLRRSFPLDGTAMTIIELDEELPPGAFGRISSLPCTVQAFYARGDGR